MLKNKKNTSLIKKNNNVTHLSYNNNIKKIFDLEILRNLIQFKKLKYNYYTFNYLSIKKNKIFEYYWKNYYYRLFYYYSLNQKFNNKSNNIFLIKNNNNQIKISNKKLKYIFTGNVKNINKQKKINKLKIKISKITRIKKKNFIFFFSKKSYFLFLSLKKYNRILSKKYLKKKQKKNTLNPKINIKNLLSVNYNTKQYVKYFKNSNLFYFIMLKYILYKFFQKFFIFFSNLIQKNDIFFKNINVKKDINQKYYLYYLKNYNYNLYIILNLVYVFKILLNKLNNYNKATKHIIFLDFYLRYSKLFEIKNLLVNFLFQIFQIFFFFNQLLYILKKNLLINIFKFKLYYSIKLFKNNSLYNYNLLLPFLNNNIVNLKKILNYSFVNYNNYNFYLINWYFNEKLYVSKKKKNIIFFKNNVKQLYLNIKDDSLYDSETMLYVNSYEHTQKFLKYKYHMKNLVLSRILNKIKEKENYFITNNFSFYNILQNNNIKNKKLKLNQRNKEIFWYYKKKFKTLFFYRYYVNFKIRNQNMNLFKLRLKKSNPFASFLPHRKWVLSYYIPNNIEIDFKTLRIMYISKPLLNEIYFPFKNNFKFISLTFKSYGF